MNLQALIVFRPARRTAGIGLRRRPRDRLWRCVALCSPFAERPPKVNRWGPGHRPVSNLRSNFLTGPDADERLFGPALCPRRSAAEAAVPPAEPCRWDRFRRGDLVVFPFLDVAQSQRLDSLPDRLLQFPSQAAGALLPRRNNRLSPSVSSTAKSLPSRRICCCFSKAIVRLVTGRPVFV